MADEQARERARAKIREQAAAEAQFLPSHTIEDTAEQGHAFYSDEHRAWFLPVAVELLNRLRAGVAPARLHFDDALGLVVTRLEVIDAQIMERSQLVRGLTWALAWIEAIDQVPDREAEPREYDLWRAAAGVVAEEAERDG